MQQQQQQQHFELCTAKRAGWVVLVHACTYARARARTHTRRGAKACVALYKAGTILDIYREARAKLGKRPWALDDCDAFLSRTKQ